MARRSFTLAANAALALALTFGLTATAGAARADDHSGRHVPKSHEQHQQSSAQGDSHRDHAGARHTQSDQNGGGRSYDRSGGGYAQGRARSDSWNQQGGSHDSGHGYAQRSSGYNSSYGYDSSYDNHGQHGGYDNHHGYDSHGHGGHGYYSNGYGYNGYYNNYGYGAAYGVGYGVAYVPTYSYLYGGVYYNTNDYGAAILRNSVNYGYQQGLAFAYQARAAHWGYDAYLNCDPYRVASYGFEPGYIDPAQYSYYYRVGFERGYREGFYGPGPAYSAGYVPGPIYSAGYVPGPVALVVGALDVILNLHHLDHHDHYGHH